MRLAVYNRLDPGFSLCRDIRTAVFVDEYNIPINKERDNQDYRATHYLIRQTDNTPIGVARSYVEGDYCKIQRFALLPSYRNETLRKQAFALVLKDCETRYPFMPLQIFVPEQECGFYREFGFVSEGEAFLYAGFKTRTMNLPAKVKKTSLTNPHLAVITESIQAE